MVGDEGVAGSANMGEGRKGNSLFGQDWVESSLGVLRGGRREIAFIGERITLTRQPRHSAREKRVG